jgi:hypothetical protein
MAKDMPPATDEERVAKVREVATNLRAALEEFFTEVVAYHASRTQGEMFSTTSTTAIRKAALTYIGLDGQTHALNEDTIPRIRVHILKAPTGAGKTSQTIRFIGEKKEWIFNNDGSWQEGDPIKPIVMLLPTYNNIEELRNRSKVLNLDGSLSDKELRQQAMDNGLIHEDDLEAKLAELRRDALDAGLRTMIYKGKIAAGCAEQEKVQMAMAAGVGTAAFCKTEKKNELGDIEEDVCEHYYDCPAIKQRAEIENCHVVFMPHPFLSLNVPEQLKDVRAVIADERIHHLFLHTAVFNATSLMIPRKPPRLTKKEREAGASADDLMVERESAVDIALNALREGMCPAHALYAHENPHVVGENNERPGFKLVKSAIRVCSAAIQKDGDLSPSMSFDEVKALCEQPTGMDVREEYRFWKIIQERMQMLTTDALIEYNIANLTKELDSFTGEYDFDQRQELERRLAREKTKPRKAKGNREMRIQFLTEHMDGDPDSKQQVKEMIRISWRSAPNWSSAKVTETGEMAAAPMMLLDASAAPDIIKKIWGGEEPVVHDISGPLNVRTIGIVNRTFSNASLIGTPGSPADEKALTAKRLTQVRLALSMISGLYGWSRVVCGASIVVRRAINNGWAGPQNADWCHFGAMRGLDFAKYHAAAFSVGRMEVSVRSIDGLVAALTFDDDLPEEPFDRFGTGLDERNLPLRLPMGDQRLRMRNGRVVLLPAPMYPGKWGRLIQRQYREEELLQFVGRLRPVYREGEAPVWFALSSVIPEEMIVDDLIHIEDMIGQGRTYLWDAVRRCGGVIDPMMMALRCDDLFKDEADAKKVAEEMGFDFTKGKTTHRSAWGFVSVRWRTNGGDWKIAYVLAEGNPAATLADALAANLKHAVAAKMEETLPAAYKSLNDLEVEEIAPGRTKTMARARVADKIDIELGDLDQRRAGENAISEEAVNHVFEKGLARRDMVHNSRATSFPISFQAGTDENLKFIWMSQGDLQANLAIEKLWRKLQYEKGMSDENPVLSDTKDTFDKMGNHVSDG